MEQFEIAATPVRTMDDLLAKLDLISGAMNQLLTDRDRELLRVVNLRIQELGQDFDTVADPSRSAMKRGTDKLRKIRETLDLIQSDGTPFYN